MADHYYVELVIDWLESNWDSSNYPGTGGDGGGLNGKVPAIVDGDDNESQEFAGRKVAYDLSKNNAIEVSSSPDRQQTPAGTEYNYRYEDGVSIRVVAMHADVVDHGAGIGVSGSSDFRALYQEVRRLLHANRSYPDPNPDGRQHALTLEILDESNLSSNYTDFYEYRFTATFRGREDL
jgi:hypothetical protein